MFLWVVSSHHYEIIFKLKKKEPLCMLGKFCCCCLMHFSFYKIKYFQKILSGLPSECQTVWIQIWPRGYKTFLMLNSAEYEIYPAYKC